MSLESELQTGKALAEALAAHLERMRVSAVTFNARHGGREYVITAQQLPSRDAIALAPPRPGQHDWCSNCGLGIEFAGGGWRHAAPVPIGHDPTPTHPWGA